MNSEEPESTIQQAEVPRQEAGRRVDQVAARLFPSYSRSLLARWLGSGALTVDGELSKPKQKLRGGERLALDISSSPFENWSEPQDVAFECVYEDEHLLVINKPHGLVVHPGAGNLDGTLVNGLLARRASQSELPRAGIVHRLDKDTSGLMLVAASLPALNALSSAIASRQVERRYLALAEGHLQQPQTVDAPLGRDPKVPTRQCVRTDGRQAITHLLPVQQFAAQTLLEARLETGRTHQIRVHLAHIGHPLVGDERYGGRLSVELPARGQSLEFRRQALHASALALTHPVTGRELGFEAEPPPDFQTLLQRLGAGAE